MNNEGYDEKGAELPSRAGMIRGLGGERVLEQYDRLVAERRPVGMTSCALLLHKAQEICRGKDEPYFQYAPGPTTARASVGHWNPDA